MRIEFDFDFGPDGQILGRHFVETSPGGQPQSSHPTLGAIPVDVIHLIAAFHTGTIPIAGTGWDVITKHPTYPGQTRLAALIGEIIRLNDAPSRAILGV